VPPLPEPRVKIVVPSKTPAPMIVWPIANVPEATADTVKTVVAIEAVKLAEGLFVDPIPKDMIWAQAPKAAIGAINLVA
jgi:hypothetical protein